MPLETRLDAKGAYEVAGSYARLYDLVAELTAAEVAVDAARKELKRAEAEVKALREARSALIVEVVPHPIRAGDAARIADITKGQVSRLTRGIQGGRGRH
jgi:hypothetical protein